MPDRKNLERCLEQIKSDKTHYEKEIARLQDLLVRLQPVEDNLTALINSLPDTSPKPQRQPKAKTPRQSQTDINKSNRDRILYEIKDAGASGRRVQQIKQSLPDINERRLHAALRNLRDRSLI